MRNTLTVYAAILLILFIALLGAIVTTSGAKPIPMIEFSGSGGTEHQSQPVDGRLAPTGRCPLTR